MDAIGKVEGSRSGREVEHVALWGVDEDLVVEDVRFDAFDELIGASEVPELWYLLPDFYATDEPSVGWIMRRSTEGVIRGLAGTTNFYYSPTPGGTIGGRPTLATVVNTPFFDPAGNRLRGTAVRTLTENGSAEVSEGGQRSARGRKR